MAGTLFSAVYDAVHHKLAELRGKGDEIGGETCDAHDQIRETRRIFIGLKQRVFVQNVDVQKSAAHGKMGFDDRADQIDGIFTVGNGGVQFQLEGNRVAITALNPGNRLGHGREGAVLAETGVRIASV